MTAAPNIFLNYKSVTLCACVRRQEKKLGCERTLQPKWVHDRALLQREMERAVDVIAGIYAKQSRNGERDRFWFWVGTWHSKGCKSPAVSGGNSSYNYVGWWRVSNDPGQEPQVADEHVNRHTWTLCGKQLIITHEENLRCKTVGKEDMTGWAEASARDAPVIQSRLPDMFLVVETISKVCRRFTAGKFCIFVIVCCSNQGMLLSRSGLYVDHIHCWCGDMPGSRIDVRRRIRTVSFKKRPNLKMVHQNVQGFDLRRNNFDLIHEFIATHISLVCPKPTWMMIIQTILCVKSKKSNGPARL